MIYLPMTADIITVGHIRVLRYLAAINLVTVGLLSPKALKGYKKVIVPYEERKEILESIIWVNRVVKQTSLNPYKNLIRYNSSFIASGDGWEKEELEAGKKAGCKFINVNLHGEKDNQKLYSSSKIKWKLKQLLEQEAAQKE
jgi:cytidyltransferase-like protein